MDNRISRLAAQYDATYTRYADDITISLADEGHDLHALIGGTIAILQNEGYQPHIRKKFDVRRRHQRQEVTGLVVNARVNLPRTTRRWLRAVEHRTRQLQDAPPAAYRSDSASLRAVKRPTITSEQLAGWRGLVIMIERQRSDFVN
jgi:hypothetical protein